MPREAHRDPGITGKGLPSWKERVWREHKKVQPEVDFTETTRRVVTLERGGLPWKEECMVKARNEQLEGGHLRYHPKSSYRERRRMESMVRGAEECSTVYLQWLLQNTVPRKRISGGGAMCLEQHTGEKC